MLPEVHGDILHERVHVLNRQLLGKSNESCRHLVLASSKLSSSFERVGFIRCEKIVFIDQRVCSFSQQVVRDGRTIDSQCL